MYINYSFLGILNVTLHNNSLLLCYFILLRLIVFFPPVDCKAFVIMFNMGNTVVNILQFILRYYVHNRGKINIVYLFNSFIHSGQWVLCIYTICKLITQYVTHVFYYWIQLFYISVSSGKDYLSWHILLYAALQIYIWVRMQ